MFKDILDYQKKDLELNKVQRELDSLPSRKVVEDMVATVKDLQLKSQSLEKQAGELKQTYDKMIDEITELDSLISNFDKSIDQKEAITILTKYNNSLIAMQNKIVKLQSKIEEVLKQFDLAKKKVVLAKTKHKEAKLSIEKSESILLPKIEKLKSDLASSRKNIKAELMKKYDDLKADNVMPVFVYKMDDSCGGCRMEISARGLEQVRVNNFIECENCRRIIINKD